MSNPVFFFVFLKSKKTVINSLCTEFAKRVVAVNMIHIATDKMIDHPYIYFSHFSIKT